MRPEPLPDTAAVALARKERGPKHALSSPSTAQHSTALALARRGLLLPRPRTTCCCKHSRMDKVVHGYGFDGVVAASFPLPPFAVCRCMGPNDQEVWECRSRLGRSLIARRCFFFFQAGVLAWLQTILFCLLCMLGQAGCYTTICRPAVAKHVLARRQQKVQAARGRAQALIGRMRSEAEQGHTHLAQAKRECLESAAFQDGPPEVAQACFTDPSIAPPPPPPPQIVSQVHDINFHLQVRCASMGGAYVQHDAHAVLTRPSRWGCAVTASIGACI